MKGIRGRGSFSTKSSINSYTIIFTTQRLNGRERGWRAVGMGEGRLNVAESKRGRLRESATGGGRSYTPYFIPISIVFTHPYDKDTHANERVYMRPVIC